MIRIKTTGIRRKKIAQVLMPFVDVALKLKAPNFYIAEEDLPEVGDRVVAKLRVTPGDSRALSLLDNSISPVFLPDVALSIPRYEAYPIIPESNLVTIEGLQGMHTILRVTVLPAGSHGYVQPVLDARLELIKQLTQMVPLGNYNLDAQGKSYVLNKRDKALDPVVLEKANVSVVILGKCSCSPEFLDSRNKQRRLRAVTENAIDTSFLIGVQVNTPGSNTNWMSDVSKEVVHSLLDAYEDLELLKPIREYKQSLEAVLGLRNMGVNSSESFLIIPFKKSNLDNLVLSLREIDTGENVVDLPSRSPMDLVRNSYRGGPGLQALQYHNGAAITHMYSLVDGSPTPASVPATKELIDSVELNIDGKVYKSLCEICPRAHTTCGYKSDENAMLGCAPAVAMYNKVIAATKKTEKAT